jgi:UDP-glucose 4-epimerase
LFQAENMPITENAPIQVAMSPYGNTKQIGEEIITDTAKSPASVQSYCVTLTLLGRIHPQQ